MKHISTTFKFNNSWFDIGEDGMLGVFEHGPTGIGTRVFAAPVDTWMYVKYIEDKKASTET